jgi:hypothetical protein
MQSYRWKAGSREALVSQCPLRVGFVVLWLISGVGVGARGASCGILILIIMQGGGTSKSDACESVPL